MLPYTPFAFACRADALTTATSGLDVYLHTHLVAADPDARRVGAVRVATWERQIDLVAAAVVDASGDATAARLAGAATETVPVAERQLLSLVFVLQRVDTDALTPGVRLALLRALTSAEQAGRLPKGASNLSLAPTRQAGEVVCKLALSGITDLYQ